MSVASSIGSPTFMAAISATNSRSNSSYTASCTMNRLAAMHDWPLLMHRATAATLAASGSFADGMTTNGSLPPSSSTTFLISLPAIEPTDWPAGSTRSAWPR